MAAQIAVSPPSSSKELFVDDSNASTTASLPSSPSSQASCSTMTALSSKELFVDDSNASTTASFPPSPSTTASLPPSTEDLSVDDSKPSTTAPLPSSARCVHFAERAHNMETNSLFLSFFLPKQMPCASNEATAMFKKHKGFISNGDDLLVALMTIEEAKVKAAEMPECKAFTFSGESSDKPVTIYFKSKWDCQGKGWTSFEKVSPEACTNTETPSPILPPPRPPPKEPPRFRNLQEVMLYRGDAWVLATILKGAYTNGGCVEVFRHDIEVEQWVDTNGGCLRELPIQNTSAKKQYDLGELLDYYTSTEGGWIPTTVIGAKPSIDGKVSLMVEATRGSWISPEQVPQKLRSPRAGQAVTVLA